MRLTQNTPALIVSRLADANTAQPLVCIAAYTTPVAKIADRHCDIILVGDSVGMVMHGLPDTLGVTMDMMILHGKAVCRGARQALIVVDLPFGSYEKNPEQAFENAALLMRETNCGAVKLEGGAHMAATIAYLVARGIPVMAHIGLTPQSVNTLGGYGVQGRGADGDRILNDARAVEAAGAFSVVLENIPEALARTISGDISIPTIGIGASAACSGQILVVDDLIGSISDFKPRFVKRYGDVAKHIETAIAEYAGEVRGGLFPTKEYVYSDSSECPNAGNAI